MKVKVMIIVGLALLSLASILPNVTGQDEAPKSADLVFSGQDFGDGEQQDVVATEDGLTLVSSALSGHYISPVIDAPFPYNAVVPQWIAEIPGSASIAIQLRTGTGDGRWSEWFTIHDNHDWTLPDDPDMVGDMITVPATDVTHDELQYSVSLSRFDGLPSPTFNELRLTFIDSTNGPSTESLVASQEAVIQSAPESAESGYPRPPVISRDIWCTHSDCNYSDGLEYENVTHLILHHTVSNNNNSDWAAVVRAIWSFHTFTRGWGDIGYNYLVDMNGVIYEGHLGGDDVAGTHAAQANKGSMALAMIGDFRTVTPPSAMRDSAANLFAWKADQKNIDVYDAGMLPQMDWGLPHLMGHRDVYGTTQCPGDRGHDLLPWLRNEVASRINFTSPYIYVDELSNAFTRSNSSTWNSTSDLSIGGCGFNGHSYYTWSTRESSSSTEWGEWRPPLGATGRYEIQVYVPFCKTGRSETEGAHYTVSHANGNSEVFINQEEGLGTWMTLGQYNLNVGNSTVIRLTDLTSTDEGKGIWFDAIRLRPVQDCMLPVISNQEPAENAWIKQRTVHFKWAVSGAFCVGTTTLEVATDPDFNDPVLSVALSGAPTSYDLTFTKDYPHLYWRIEAVTTQNRVGTSMPTRFGIDTEPPESRVSNIYITEAGDYYLSITGEDNASGVVSYNIDYRTGNEEEWQRWLTKTPITTIPVPWDIEQNFWFRSQGIDILGNTEAIHSGDGDANTDQAIQLHRVIMSPLFWQD
jgi:hypothetical protein